MHGRLLLGQEGLVFSFLFFRFGFGRGFDVSVLATCVRRTSLNDFPAL